MSGLDSAPEPEAPSPWCAVMQELHDLISPDDPGPASGPERRSPDPDPEGGPAEGYPEGDTYLGDGPPPGEPGSGEDHSWEDPGWSRDSRVTFPDLAEPPEEEEEEEEDEDEDEEGQGSGLEDLPLPDPPAYPEVGSWGGNARQTPAWRSRDEEAEARPPEPRRKWTAPTGVPGIGKDNLQRQLIEEMRMRFTGEQEASDTLGHVAPGQSNPEQGKTSGGAQILHWPYFVGLLFTVLIIAAGIGYVLHANLKCN